MTTVSQDFAAAVATEERVETRLRLLIAVLTDNTDYTCWCRSFSSVWLVTSVVIIVRNNSFVEWEDRL